MDGVLVAFVGVIVGALIGWLVALDAAGRTTQRERSFREEDRRLTEDALRRALGEELRANSRLLRDSGETRRFASTQTAAWHAAIGLPFRQQQSREHLQNAYMKAAQFNQAAIALPPAGSGNPLAEQSNICGALAKAALAAMDEAERLYVANQEDPAHPGPMQTAVPRKS